MTDSVTIGFRRAASARVPAAVLLALALGAAGCGTSGSGNGDPTRHRVPGQNISLELPETWDAVGSTSPKRAIEAFQSRHPRFIAIAERLRSSADVATLAAAEGSGDVRLLVSVSATGPGVTLESHAEANLAALEDEAPSRLKVRVDGSRHEIVDLDGVPAWRLRWSYEGDLGRVRLVQYTVVRDGLVTIFTYSTLAPWSQAAEVFEQSSRSIRLGAATGSHVGPVGVIAFERERQDGSSDLYTVPAAGGSERRLTRTGKEGQPVWSPDGSRIAFVSTRDGNREIYVMDADGGGQTRVTARPGPDSAPAWSADGRRLLFTSGDCSRSCDLFVINSDGTGIERLTDDGSSADGSWSPDGERIAFWSGRAGGSAIVVMSTDGTDARRLTEGLGTAWGADWSPDGRTILVAGTEVDDPDETQAIYRISADGGDVQRVAPARGFWVDEPEWSPDGRSIAFFSDTEGPGAIWIMNADGTGQRPLTRRGDSHSPSWRP